MRNILVVDNRKAHIELIERALQSEYNILTAESSTEAMEILNHKEEPVAVILLEIDKYGMHGMEFVADLRANDLCKEIPVVLLTGNVMIPEIETAWELGVKEIIPFNLPAEMIKKRIKWVLQEYSGAEEKREKPLAELVGIEQDDFVFHSGIGPAMLLEYDGKVLIPVMVNDAFYAITRQDKEKSRFNGDILSSISPAEVDKYRKALDDALESGTGYCQITNYQTNEILRISVRHLTHGAYGDVLLALVEDVTESFYTMMKADALLELPGTIIYDYDPVTDRMVINISSEDGLKSLISDNILKNEVRQEWLSAESEGVFRNTFRKIMEHPSSGNIDFRAKLEGDSYHWYRAYYRSMAYGSGEVFRIIGRVERIKDFQRIGSAYANAAIYDATTRLLTYQAIREYIAHSLKANKSGTMIILAIDDLDQLREKLGQDVIGKVLVTIAENISKLFYKGDILGRFGEEGFVIFLPDAYSVNLARKKAAEILECLDETKKDLDSLDVLMHCHMGICVAEQEDTTVMDLLKKANIARWSAHDTGKGRFRIFNEIPQANVLPEFTEM